MQDGGFTWRTLLVYLVYLVYSVCPVYPVCSVSGPLTFSL